MRKHRLVVASVGLLAVALAGCSSASEEEQIAADACGLLQGILDDGFEAAFDPELMEDFAELEERAEDADISDEEMEEAMQSECPDVMDGLGGMFGGF